MSTCFMSQRSKNILHKTFNRANLILKKNYNICVLRIDRKNLYTTASWNFPKT